MTTGPAERTWPSPEQHGPWQVPVDAAGADEVGDGSGTRTDPAEARETPSPEAPSSGSPSSGERGGVLRPVRDLWARTPLLARLVGISTVLLATGLAVAGTITTTALSSYLIGQVDQRLDELTKTSAEKVLLYYRTGGDLTQLNDSVWQPADYALETSILGETGTIDPAPSTTEEYGEPGLPDLTLDSVAAYATTRHTVSSTVTGSAWRVAVRPVQASLQDPTILGWVTVAQPLGDVQDIVRRAALLLWSSAVAILVIGIIVGTWAVRRSLRPLREIEDVAATIAAGDLSRRVPEAPVTTEVGRLGAALNGMLAQIEVAFDARTASEERMRRFVADASHELRTPLAAIRGYGELYRMGALTEKEQVDDTLRRIEQSATRMGGLVEDLLALARLDADRAARTEPVDLAVLATDAAHDLRALDPTREVHVGALPGAGDAAGPTASTAVPATASTPARTGARPASRTDPRAEARTDARTDTGGCDVDHVFGPTVVLGDEPRLRQVIANLVGNVARHTPSGSPVEILVGRRGDEVVLEVRDHGPGIAPEHAHRVFERFYRVDASRTRDGDGHGGGAGLGMAIVAAIVTAHHGRVEIVRTEGGGATVRVALPTGGHLPESDDGDHPTA
ncbi:MAG TPA: HAMP domain-containing sensor histidine kinase [Cellulomonas sp.]